VRHREAVVDRQTLRHRQGHVGVDARHQRRDHRLLDRQSGDAASGCLALSLADQPVAEAQRGLRPFDVDEVHQGDHRPQVAGVDVLAPGQAALRSAAVEVAHHVVKAGVDRRRRALAELSQVELRVEKIRHLDLF